MEAKLISERTGLKDNPRKSGIIYRVCHNRAIIYAEIMQAARGRGVRLANKKGRGGKATCLYTESGVFMVISRWVTIHLSLFSFFSWKLSELDS